MPESVTASERTRIQLCGRLSVEIDGAELVGSLRGRQVPLLLAYLVLNRNRSLGREELIGAMWPEAAPRSQDAALRTLLSRLRSALGAGILSGRDELVLELPAPTWVDVEAALAEMTRAQEALQRGDARAAWALAQVPLNISGRGLLPGVQATWLEGRRRELADLRTQALEVIGRAGLRLGPAQLGSVERAARTLIETVPYRESGYVLLMSALERGGNIAEGLRVFERLRSLVRDELGTVPSPEAIAAHQRLLHPGGHPGGEPEPGAGRAAPTATAIALPPELAVRIEAPLVGRRDELTELESWRTSPERRRVMLLTGDPGIGKTRLLAETGRRAHAEGAVVLAGRAPEETLVPYQPLLEALNHYVAGAPLPELRTVAREHGSELARLLPALRRRLPDLPPADPGDPETDRYRLFEAVAGLLGAIAATVPVLVVLDDLHWADRPTLLLLRHLARSSQTSRLLILGAYRSGERRTEAFEAALAALRHDRLMATLELGGLAAEAAIELMRLRAGEMPSLAFAQALYRETEGNPFFIEEILRHLSDSGVRAQDGAVRELERLGLPDDVRDVIFRRLARLREGTLEWLRVAAVIGRDFDSGLLERVLNIDEEAFLAALEDALDGALVAETPGEHGRYSFSHALIRETLYTSMSSTRRTRVHRRIGVALEEAGGEDRISALAHHFTAAAGPEDADRAIRYAVRAGRQATAMLAHEEAAEHYARALEVLKRTEPEASGRSCELLLELGEARERSGERPQAWAVFREAATLAARLGDGAALVRAAIGASRRYVQPPGVVDEELIALLERALEMAGEQTSVARVRLLARLCGALYYSPRRGEMAALSEEATAIAAQLRDPQAAALAASARRRACWRPGHLARRLADSTELLRSAIAAGNAELTLEGHAWLVVDLLENGDRDGVDAQISAFVAGAEDLRQPLFLWNAGVWRAMLALIEGRLRHAEQHALTALSLGLRSDGVTSRQYYAIQLLAIRREQARMAELEGPTRSLVASNPGRPAWRGALATLLCDTGRHEEARTELEAVAGDDLPTIPRDGDWLIAVTVLADVAADLGHEQVAARLYELLAPHRDSVVVIGLGAVCQGSTARYLGRLALVLGRREEAVAHLRHAVDVARALRAPVAQAHAELECARALGPGSEATALVARAAATAAELDLPWVAARADRLREG